MEEKRDDDQLNDIPFDQAGKHHIGSYRGIYAEFGKMQYLEGLTSHRTRGDAGKEISGHIVEKTIPERNPYPEAGENHFETKAVNGENQENKRERQEEQGEGSSPQGFQQLFRIHEKPDENIDRQPRRDGDGNPFQHPVIFGSLGTGLSRL